VVVEDWIDYEDGNTKIAIYDRPGDEADAVKFHGLMMFQKEKWVCLSRSSSNEVIRVTDVPSMEFKREPAETVDQALDADLTKYQRPSDASRVDTVSAWFGDGGNFIVNSGLVWLQEMVESQDLKNLNTLLLGLQKEKWNWIRPFIKQCYASLLQRLKRDTSIVN